jgi:hypothetical protein
MSVLTISMAALPAYAGNKNFGKAEDYGSARFAQVNQCEVQLVGKGQTPDPKGIALSQCMKRNGYQFMSNARVFGNSGPRCKDDEEGVFHSWCWSISTKSKSTKGEKVD